MERSLEEALHVPGNEPSVVGPLEVEGRAVAGYCREAPAADLCGAGLAPEHAAAGVPVLRAAPDGQAGRGERGAAEEGGQGAAQDAD